MIKILTETKEKAEQIWENIYQKYNNREINEVLEYFMMCPLTEKHLRIYLFPKISILFFQCNACSRTFEGRVFDEVFIVPHCHFLRWIKWTASHW